MKYILFVVIITFCSITGCDSKLDLKNFDEEKWKADTHGCNGVRLGMHEALENEKDMIRGLNQDDIITLLGKPDQNELYKRNQKFFIYYISPKNCDEKKFEPYTYLSIRFNATGLAKEVIIYTE